jgi:hypothetical protein
MDAPMSIRILVFLAARRRIMQRRTIARALVAPLFVLLAGGLSSAAEPERTSSDRVATFRAQFDDIAAKLVEIASALGDPASAVRMEQAVAALQSVPDEDLARVIDGANVDLTDLGQAIATVQENLDTAQAARAQSPPGPARAMSAGFPDAPSVLVNCDDILHDSAFVYGFLIGKTVADGILAATEFVCEQDILGENTAFAPPSVRGKRVTRSTRGASSGSGTSTRTSRTASRTTTATRSTSSTTTTTTVSRSSTTTTRTATPSSPTPTRTRRSRWTRSRR